MWNAAAQWMTLKCPPCSNFLRPCTPSEQTPCVLPLNFCTLVFMRANDGQGILGIGVEFRTPTKQTHVFDSPTKHSRCQHLLPLCLAALELLENTNEYELVHINVLPTLMSLVRHSSVFQMQVSRFRFETGSQHALSCYTCAFYGRLEKQSLFFVEMGCWGVLTVFKSHVALLTGGRGFDR